MAFSALSTIGEAMTRETISYAALQRDAPVRRARTATLTAAFGEITRDKPRDPVEAEFLRRIGTPERLIGPVRGS